MRKLLLILLAAMPLLAQAQPVHSTATFEALPLSKADTFYVNYAHPGQDVGFDNGVLHFPCVYDTAYGGLWDAGFAYTNKTDSVTSGYTNMYAAKAGKGYNGSAKYATYWAGYGAGQYIKTAVSHAVFYPQSVYLTNNTYAYNSMKNGDAVAKKFGGATGNDPDWYKVVVRGYLNGAQKPDSVAFYLADYRSSNNASDYIIKDWTLLNLTTLGGVDSINFALSSSDNGTFGMNTPSYFCMDDLTVNILGTGVGNLPAENMARVYPNPATNRLFIDLNAMVTTRATIYDVTGKVIAVQDILDGKAEINTSAYANGTYLLKLEDKKGAATVRFTKQ